MEYYVYIIRNKNNKTYIGHTCNIIRRLKEHNENRCTYASKLRPWSLIYKEKFYSRSEAIKKEKYFKTGIGREWIYKNVL